MRRARRRRSIQLLSATPHVPGARRGPRLCRPTDANSLARQAVHPGGRHNHDVGTIGDLAYRHEDRRLHLDGVIPGYSFREWRCRRWCALPSSAPRANPRVARLLHEAGIWGTDGGIRACAVARQHRSSLCREPCTCAVECLLPRRQIRERRQAAGTFQPATLPVQTLSNSVLESSRAWHYGVLVFDLDVAIERLASLLGWEFNPPKASSSRPGLHMLGHSAL